MTEEVRIIEVSEDKITVEIVEEVITVEIGEDAVAPVWGMIEGDLQNQTDLTEALRGKADADHEHDDRYYTKTETASLLNGKADIIIAAAEGEPAELPDGTENPAEEVTAGIRPNQSGSGDPSPENVRPISGRTECNISVTPEGTTYSISFGEAGIVYGARLNATTGQLTVTHGIVDLGKLSWTRNTSGSNPYFRASLADTKRYAINTQTDCFSDRYKLIASVNGSSFAANANNNECTILSNSAILAIRNDSYTSAASFKEAMDGAQFVYELAETEIYQLEGQEIRMTAGENTISADTGPVAVRYRADTKGYIDKLIAELQALILEN
ncbi:MAG: hypothetical protein IKP86_12310 [Anaerolineaceae bacterium]|nr:hypothetical protein [Anaerolineaceae bacterium]